MLLLAVAAAALTAPLAIPAEKQPVEERSHNVASIAVHTADLDLTAPEGLHRLDRRLRVAIRQACSTPSPLTARDQQRVRACISETGKAASLRRDALVAQARLRRDSLAYSRE